MPSSPAPRAPKPYEKAHASLKKQLSAKLNQIIEGTYGPSSSSAVTVEDPVLQEIANGDNEYITGRPRTQSEVEITRKRFETSDFDEIYSALNTASETKVRWRRFWEAGRRNFTNTRN